jgi:hypothetical protein
MAPLSRRMFFTSRSDGELVGPDFCLICAPRRLTVSPTKLGLQIADKNVHARLREGLRAAAQGSHRACSQCAMGRSSSRGRRHRGLAQALQRGSSPFEPRLFDAGRVRRESQADQRSSRFRNGPGAARHGGLRAPARCSTVLEGTIEGTRDAGSLKLTVLRRIKAVCQRALVDQTISAYGAAQAVQRHDRLTGPGHRPKVRKILHTTFDLECRSSPRFVPAPQYP